MTSLPWNSASGNEVRCFAVLGDRREFLTFSTSAADMRPFAVEHNDRVAFTKGAYTGRKATVCGVHQCTLWVLLDGEKEVRDLKHCHNHANVEHLYGMVREAAPEQPETKQASPWNDHSANFMRLREKIAWCNDGVLSVASLVIALAVIYSGQVALIGGLLMTFGGAATVASSEFVSSSVEAELTAWELETEKTHLQLHAEDEARNLNQLLSEFFSEETNRLIQRDTQGKEKLDTQLSLHAKLEFGVDNFDRLNGPTGILRRAVTAFFSFVVGGCIPLLPWLFMPHASSQMKVAAMLLLIFSFDLAAGTWYSAGKGSSPVWFAVMRQIGVTVCCVTATLLSSVLARRINLL